MKNEKRKIKNGRRCVKRRDILRVDRRVFLRIKKSGQVIYLYYPAGIYLLP